MTFLWVIGKSDKFIRYEEWCICNELGGGRRRLYSDATGVGLSGSHKEQQTHSSDGI